MDSDEAPRVWAPSSLKPMTEIMHGRQQQITPHRMNGIAYPMQLKVKNTIHNLRPIKKNVLDVRLQGEDLMTAQRRYIFFP